MHLHLQAVFYVATVVVPVVVTGKPQIHLGDIWIGKASESPKDDDDAPAKPLSVSTDEGGLKVISAEEPDITGYIQLQVFLSKTNSGKDLVKIHDSNSSFTIPESFSSSQKRISRKDKKCGEGELVYEENGECYKAGPVTPGIDSPCADDFMQFVQLSDKPGYGDCFCLRFKGSTTRPVVYWEKSNRCYWIYDQGPCEKGQWLVYSNDTDSDGIIPLICTARTCPENSEENDNSNFPKFWFEHKGKCYQTETQSVEFCGVGKKKIYFANDKPEPICAERRTLPTGVKGLASVVNFLNCKAGHKKLPNGDCKRVASFE